MKKILITFLFASSVGTLLPGCLKDEGFDNHEYGINDPDTQPPGVGFPLGTRLKNDFGLEVIGTPQVVSDMVFVNLNSGAPAPSDITITISDNSQSLVDAYNAATGRSLEPLPANLFAVPTTITIPAGERFAKVDLVVSSTLTLDPAVIYGVGLTITQVSGNYKIAENMKNLFIAFSIKNKYDGKYRLNGQFYHPTASPYLWYTTTVEMHTSGPNSVRMYWPLAGAFGHPWETGGGLAYFGAQEPEYTIDPSTEKITVFNSFTGATTVYQMGLGFDNAGYDSRWEDPDKTMFVCFGYNLGPGGELNPAASRLWVDTLIRTGPR